MVLHKKKKKEISNAKYKNETIKDIGSHKVSREKELRNTFLRARLPSPL